MREIVSKILELSEQYRNCTAENLSKLVNIKSLSSQGKYDDFLDKGSVTVTNIESQSPSLCAVPDFCKVHLDRRLTWGEDKKSMLDEIQSLLKNKKNKTQVLKYKEKSYTGLIYEMEQCFLPWKIPINNVAVKTAIKTFKELFKKAPEVDKWLFSTNGVVTNGIYKIPTIGFGPGDEKAAHAPDEKIEIDDLVRASAFYTYYAYMM